MSADILTRAAALMRARAERATPGRWEADRHFTGDGSVVMADGLRRAHLPRDSGGHEANAEHAAGMDPAVALDLADWLDDTAAIHTPERSTPHNEPYGCGQCFPHDGHWPCGDYKSALTVARTYLGETS